MKYLIGLGVIAFGVILVLKTEWLVQNFGRVEWAERYLGYEGGTRIFYKLFGVILIIISFLVMAGVFDQFLVGTFGGFFEEGPTESPVEQ